MEVGIIGLPNVGKSTIFSLLTKISVAIDSFPFTTIQPNIGIVEVPDEDLDYLEKIFKPKKKTYATIKFVDIAGLIKGAHKGEGLGNRFLASIREVDAVVQVLRFFKDTSIASSIGEINPLEEVEIVFSELALADLEVLQNYKSKLLAKASVGDKQAKLRLDVVDGLISVINSSSTFYEIKDFVSKQNNSQDKELFSLFKQLLLNKEIIYLLNYDEETSKDEIENVKQQIEKKMKCKVLSLCGKFELGLVEFSKEEQMSLRQEYNIPDSEIKDFIKEASKILHLITFYTTVGEEIRAWMIKEGCTILDAAGKIHTDMKEGFINAEVYNIEELKKYGCTKILNEKGLIRIEGKDYIVKNKDVIKINFHLRS